MDYRWLLYRLVQMKSLAWLFDETVYVENIWKEFLLMVRYFLLNVKILTRYFCSLIYYLKSSLPNGDRQNGKMSNAIEN